MTTVRPAAVAGMFYPRDPRQLAGEVSELLDGVGQFEPRLDIPKALIVPHAGYVYSGPVAAAAYDVLAPGRGIIQRVVAAAGSRARGDWANRLDRPSRTLLRARASSESSRGQRSAEAIGQMIVLPYVVDLRVFLSKIFLTTKARSSETIQNPPS